MIHFVVRPNDRALRTGLYRMVWEDDLSPVGKGMPVEYRLEEGNRVPPTNKPGQGFVFQRYISAEDWKILKKARKAVADIARAKARRQKKRRDTPPNRPTSP